MLTYLLACASAECSVGFVEQEGECVPSGSGEEDTGATTNTTQAPPPGHYDCDAGEGSPNTMGTTLRGACANCDGGSCNYTVFLIDLYGPIGVVEVDLHNSVVDMMEPWFEFHNAFVSVLEDDDGVNWSLDLAQVTGQGEYHTNVSTLVDLTNPAIAAATTFQVTAFDTIGGYLDCFVWGPDPDSLGGDCRVVE